MSIDFLSLPAVALDAKPKDKEQAFRELARVAGKLCRLDQKEIFDALWARERLGTTGVGRGIAIPHTRVPGIDGVTGFLMRLDQKLDFESTDKVPVDLIFLLLAPENAGNDHIHALANVSRVFRKTEICAQIRSAKDAKTIHQILTA